MFRFKHKSGNTAEQIKPLPFPVYFWTVLAVATAGLLDALYLSISHYRVYTDMAYKSFCAVSKAINCDTVSQSPYSIFMNVPVPVWGLLGYGAFMLLLIASWRLRHQAGRLWPSLFVLAFVFSLASIVLAWISVTFIHSYCIMCLASHAVSFMLLFLTWLVFRRIGGPSLLAGIGADMRFYLQYKKRCVLTGLGVGLVLMLTVFLFPSYWNLSQVITKSNLPTGITEDGHPWIGARNPQLIITEFTDYRCFQCKKMHFYLRQLMQRHPDKLRLVHRHFPMDHTINPLVKEPFHVGSRKMALLAIYAAQMDRFWVVSDMLFNMDTQAGHFNIRKMAKTAGFDVYEFAAAIRNRRNIQRLKQDINQGIRLGLRGTPGYLINGKMYMAHIPPEILAGLQ